MSYSVKVDYSPAYELVNSLYAFIYYKKLKPLDIKDEWVAKVKASIPEKFIVEFVDERWEVLHRIVLLITQCPRKDSVTDFLDWLEKLPPGEIFERLSPWVETIPANIGEIRDKTLSLLQLWNKYYFQHLSLDILSQLQADAALKAKRAQELSPIDLIEEVTNGIRVEQVEELKQIYVIPQYHCKPTVIHDYFKGIATYLYPVASQLNEKEIAQQNIVKLSQALSDENRLKILGFIAKHPCDLIELHKNIGLAKSTIHHHVTTLAKAGIVRRHYMGSTTVAFYSVRPSFIALLTKDLERITLSGGKKP
ncbi:ArsR/SmtB family transcription factor [Aneurinibacillus migulanus]|nr:winged helix-turn-helix domain-containing protein [Aneurinibacillus migulanus]MED0893574.1 winged helix-turn-helix domain-containing protein [Aneurinibacillus migulanus]MED1616324.1 winged helix-turn-helix domain-containing protein [Aneurinibacillus migulanus]GED17616.1 transcriptional regulator [Aneurinibacillus migulanus]SDJ45025.1 IclR helix-turn-helix domain-containing protein [Aneurinibacillus migulanus]